VPSASIGGEAFMRILCSLCAPPANVLGEKCSRCGSAVLEKTSTIRLWTHFFGRVYGPRFYCRACDFIFGAGDGGDSHTLCPMHAAQARADAGLPPKEVS